MSESRSTTPQCESDLKRGRALLAWGEQGKVALLVAVYLAAIVAANLITARYGPTASVYNAFALIGLDLITRDRLADFWGTTRWVKMALLIAAGSTLSYLIAQDAASVAEASAISFACAETGEGFIYHLLRHREWVQRANTAAWLGAAIDSLVFPTLAFGGLMWSTSVGQFTAKTAGALLWSAVIVQVRPGRRVRVEALA
jgi:queuosine precursor transporter